MARWAHFKTPERAQPETLIDLDRVTRLERILDEGRLTPSGERVTVETTRVYIGTDWVEVCETFARITAMLTKATL